MAVRLAGGDLSKRMPATGVAEIGQLERAFNDMAGSLERNRDDLAALAAEQAALRRVSTMVARGVSPDELFERVAEVRLAIRDDGAGGADPARGSGLIGLKDRVEGTGGTLRVDSRPGQGTLLLAELPIHPVQPPPEGG